MYVFDVFQMYVTLVFRTKGTRLTKPTLCLVLLSLAVLVGVLRVTEHRNHWGDVLAGFVTGGAIAAFLVRGRGGTERRMVERGEGRELERQEENEMEGSETGRKVGGTWA